MPIRPGSFCKISPRSLFLTLFILLAPAMALASNEAVVGSGGEAVAWWVWPLVLLVVTFLMGIVAVLGGVGGGVLFVPIISGFFPFHLDFVRGCGLLVALSGALAAGPGLLKANLASLRLAIPVALIASTCAIVGAMVGLALPTHVIQTSLGATILAIVVLMLMAKKSELPEVRTRPTSSPPPCAFAACTRRRARARGSTGRSTAHPSVWCCSSPWASWRACSAWARAGPMSRAEPAHGGTAQDQRGHQQVPSVHHGYVGRLDLPQQGLRHPHDGGSLVWSASCSARSSASGFSGSPSRRSCAG